ncbi:MAG: putative DNA binding domain-containing protein [Candidatus Competibacteraceae bacterium]|nr:putative DNA binding domain-containing protein [Candidatus Competibacteraceae bacterium]
MRASRSELIEKIRSGEDSFLELKEVRFAGSKIRGPEQNELADGLAAFANAHGGVLILGVHDKTREITGIPLERLDAVGTLTRQACKDCIKPPLAPIIERLTLPVADGIEQPVVWVVVERSLFVHLSPGGYLHRVGSSKRPIAPDYLARLFQQRSQSRLIRFDETPAPQARLDTLQETLWQRFAPRQPQDRSETLLSKLGMAAQDEEGVWRPTVSGILMASNDPRRYLPNAFIQAVAYRGKTVTPEGSGYLYQLDAKDISGPLETQVIETCRFVSRNMKVAAMKSMGRRDFPQYDLVAVFEAVVNAVAHRDYSIHGAKIRLRLFADRLELYSPGGLPNTLEPESLPYRQMARNETLTSLLARCPIPADVDWIETTRTTFMDRRGEGVPIILARSEALSGRLPEYRVIDQSELLLTIYAAGEVVETE